MTTTHVLVPLDGSPLAEDALGQALAVYDCPVTVLNVVTPLDDSMSESGVLEPGAERRAQARDRATRLVEQAQERTGDDDRDIEVVVETGDPAETILETVETREIDHVVMGGHGGARSGIAKRLLGTVATVVVTEAPVTVTVVR